MEKIYVFGYGKYFKKYESEIKAKYNVIKILDNYNYDGEVIIKPSPEIFEDNYKVLIMVKRCGEIIKQLNMMGVSENQIIIGENERWDKDSESERIIKDNSCIFYRDGMEYLKDGYTGKNIVISDAISQRYAEKKILREYYSKDVGIIAIKSLPTRPRTRDFGMNRGKAIDRFFIEKFLYENKRSIHGDVLEIADNQYTLLYGENYTSHIMHVEGWGDAFKGNFETGEGLIADSFDCIILTQVLMFIFDLHRTVLNIYRILRNEGIALITVSGIAQISRFDADRWGSYWKFDLNALEKLFEPIFGRENVVIETYGNFKLATAMMYGMCCEELETEDFYDIDIDYPLVYTVRVQKKNNDGVVRFIGKMQDDPIINQEKKDIVICGAGKIGKKAYDYLFENGIKTMLFADKNPSGLEQYRNTPVLDTFEVVSKYPNYQYIVCGLYKEEIANELIAYGAQNIHIWIDV